jgi:hypothetical protein
MSWRTQILAYIRGQDAYGFLDGTSRPPAQSIPNTNTDAGAPVTMANPEFLAWCQWDQMILSVLISTLTKPLVVHAIGCATAHDLWTTLVTMFASQARSRVMQIHYQLATSKKGNSSSTEYFQTIKAMSDNMAAAGQHLNDFESVSYLLAGLGSEYDPFVTSVTTRLDPLSIDELYGHLAHEMRIEHHLSSNEQSQPLAHFSAWAPLPHGHGYRDRGSSFTGRSTYRGHGSSSSSHGRGSYFLQDSTSSSWPIYTSFVERLVTLPLGTTNNLIQHYRLHLITTLKRFIRPHRCSLRKTGIWILVPLITSQMSSKISTCLPRNTLAWIRFA